MLLYLAFLLAGVVFGVFTGLVPGLHPNTVVFMSLPIYIGLGVDYLIYGSFIVGLSVSHTFHDFLPAIFLGAPEAESALSSLPGADMAARGEGLTAFHVTVYGGMFAILVFLLFSPLLVAFLEPIYTFFERFMFRVLLFFLAFIVFNTPNLRSSVFLAGLAGVLGIFSFRMPVNQQFVLMPVFSGLFAVPALFRVFQQEADLPDQKSPGADIETSARGGVIGFFSGLVSGVLPGVGPAVSTTFLSP
ncbi:MAG: tripartite tricarboxylate transporter permease, partial [Candidatus Nanohaloarchaea archaeon]